MLLPIGLNRRLGCSAEKGVPQLWLWSPSRLGQSGITSLSSSRRVERQHERIVITRNGRAAAILVSLRIWHPRGDPGNS